MDNLVLNTIELVSTTRPAPRKGSPSSDDYNQSQTETLLDLTSISEFVNNVLIPMFRALPPTALSGLEGRNMYADTTDQTTIFMDPITGNSLSVADSLRTLFSLLNIQGTTLSNINIQVGQLSTKLSSTNQNDVAITLQNITSSINTLTNQQTVINTALTELQSVGNKAQTSRSTVTITNGATVNESVLWTNPFVDNNYTVSISCQDGASGVVVQGFNYLPNGAGVNVSVTNTSGASQTLTLNLIAIHD